MVFSQTGPDRSWYREIFGDSWLLFFGRGEWDHTGEANGLKTSSLHVCIYPYPALLS